MSVSLTLLKVGFTPKIANFKRLQLISRRIFSFLPINLNQEQKVIEDVFSTHMYEIFKSL